MTTRHELLEQLIQCRLPEQGPWACDRCGRTPYLGRARPVCAGPFAPNERATLFALLTSEGETPLSCSSSRLAIVYVTDAPSGRVVLLHETPPCEHFVRTQSQPDSGLLTLDFVGFLPAHLNPRTRT